MPEGAEVRVMSESLARKVRSRVCKKITPVTGRYTKKDIPGIGCFKESKVTGVGVKGKLIFWIFNNETFLLNTLGMSGTWSNDANHKHARVRFDFETGDPVFFVDTRNFGTLKLVEGKSALISKLNTLGPDMLNEDVSYEDFSEALDICCQTVLRQAYNGRAASIRSYRDADGNSGDATLQFMVYGKKQDPLGKEIVREKTDDGRTTHWVPSVQK